MPDLDLVVAYLTGAPPFKALEERACTDFWVWLRFFCRRSGNA